MNLPPDCPPVVKLTVPIATAHRMALRSFWRGIFIGATGLGVILSAGAAFSGDTATWGGTGCQLVAVANQVHVAEVRCVNVETRGDAVTSGDMATSDLAVHLVVFHGPGDIPDLFSITPGPGFIAVPADLTLGENERGVMLIMEWLGG